MRIVLLTRSLEIGGMERQLVALAPGLQARGHHILVTVFYSGGALIEDLEDSQVPVRSLEKHGRWDIVGFLSRFFRLIIDEKPDILYTFLETPNILSIPAKILYPYMRVAWGKGSAYVDLSQYDWLRKISYRLEQLLSRFADLITINSLAGFEKAASLGYPIEKLLEIPNGFDTAKFRPDLDERRRVRAEWGIGPDELLIGLIARLDPIKDHSTFLIAASELASERTDVRFVCVGQGAANYQTELKEQAERLGIGARIQWIGSRTDMPAVYNALDMVTLSSYGEGLPNVIGEAMACGVPCVATDVGDTARIIGDFGIVVPPRDPEALSRGWLQILQLTSSERQTLGQKARERIANEFGLNLYVERTSEALECLVKSESITS